MAVSIFVESILDAAELCVAALIFSTFSTDISSLQLFEIIVVTINIIVLTYSNTSTSLKLYQVWSHEDGPEKLLSERGLLGAIHFRSTIIAGVMITILLPELIGDHESSITC